jgi:cell shape-determining protein MreC
MAAACALIVLLGVLPAGWIGFVGWIGNVLDLLLAPVQSPVAAGVRLLRGPLRAGADGDPAVAELRRQVEEFRTQRLRDWDEIQRLQRQLAALQRAAMLNPSLPVSQIAAEVIGGHSEGGGTLLKVKAGSLNGVPSDAVAVWDGVHLVGRVVDVEPRIARVRPVTDRNAAPIDGVIIPSDPGPLLAPDPMAMALETPLQPTGDGRLRGPVEVRMARAGMPPAEIVPGMIVRLRGAGRPGTEAWPEPARMLIVGVVERVETGPNDRPVVLVKPAFSLADLAEVVLRWPDARAVVPGGAR